MDAGSEVERGEQRSAEAVLDERSAQEEEQHVAEQMQPAGMEKHGRKERNNDRSDWQVRLRPGRDLGGHNAVLI